MAIAVKSLLCDLRLDVRVAEPPGPDERLVTHHAADDAGEPAIGDPSGVLPKVTPS